jgi:hypothetical protein
VLGEIFDASGALLATFDTNDRRSLIDKYGARFYHAGPTKEVVMVAKGPTAGSLCPSRWCRYLIRSGIRELAPS